MLIAERSWDYGSGKSKAVETESSGAATNQVFEPAPTAIALDPSLLEKMKSFSRNEKILKEIEINWSGPRTDRPLQVFSGPIASGAAVLENRSVIESIKSRDRKLIGVEMELYGVFLAAMICPAPRPKALGIKSICDFGDEKKTDDHQMYAAYTSAHYLYEFALAELT